MKPFLATGRRGRPRSRGPAFDSGTPELRAWRLRLAGGADPALSEHPLGLMLARGLADPAQHEAGCRYGYLYGHAVGWPHPSYAGLYRQLLGAGEGPDCRPDEEAQRRLEALFRLGKNRLLAAGRRICSATENLVVFCRFPAFLRPAGRGAGLGGADAAELEAVRTGLEALVACYGAAAGRSGRMEAHKAASLRGAAAATAPAIRNKLPERSRRS